MPGTPLRLMSTAHCSACESALDLLLGMPELRGHVLSVIEVADDERLLARYGERLPVLVVDARELGWPFGREQVCSLLGGLSEEPEDGTGV